jgi:hypothetical protein
MRQPWLPSGLSSQSASKRLERALDHAHLQPLRARLGVAGLKAEAHLQVLEVDARRHPFVAALQDVGGGAPGQELRVVLGLFDEVEHLFAGRAPAPNA